MVMETAKHKRKGIAAAAPQVEENCERDSNEMSRGLAWELQNLNVTQAEK